MNDPAASCFVHATALVVGEEGILIQAPSGSGKTSLALALLEEAQARGRFARLVADDRVALTAKGGRIVARPHPAIAGLVEQRGIGVVPTDHEGACVLRLVVQLVSDPGGLPERCPEAPPTIRLLGVKLPVLNLLAAAGSRENGTRVFGYFTASLPT